MAEPMTVMTGLLADAPHHEAAPHSVERPASRARRGVASRGVSMRDALESSDGFIAQVVELLSHHERMALRLRHRDGLASGAIAARMNLPGTATGNWTWRMDGGAATTELADALRSNIEAAGRL